jgi:hypothetical protein
MLKVREMDGERGSVRVCTSRKLRERLANDESKLADRKCQISIFEMQKEKVSFLN